MCCQAADHAEKRAGGILVKTKAGENCFAVDGFVLERFCRIARCQRPVGFRVPDIGVDAIEDTGQIVRAGLQKPFQTHAELRRHQLSRIGRADGGDRITHRKTGLEKPQTAPEFRALPVKMALIKAKPGHQCRVKQPLKRNVVDGHQGRGHLSRMLAEIGRNEPRLPVMRMHNIRAPAVHCSCRHMCRHL